MCKNQIAAYIYSRCYVISASDIFIKWTKTFSIRFYYNNQPTTGSQAREISYVDRA